MRSLNFDDGLESFAINGDENRVIRFCPSDINLIKRAEQVENNLNQLLLKFKNIELTPEGKPVDSAYTKILEDVEGTLRSQTNYLFNADVYDVIFAGQSPLSLVGKDGKYLYVAFFESVMPVISENIQGKNNSALKYTEGYLK